MALFREFCCSKLSFQGVKLLYINDLRINETQLVILFH